MKGEMTMGRKEEENRKVHCVENTMGYETASIETAEEKGLKGIEELLKEEDGMGTVEIILIIVVLVGLVVIFKDQITKIVDNLFNKISTQTGRI